MGGLNSFIFQTRSPSKYKYNLNTGSSINKIMNLKTIQIVFAYLSARFKIINETLIGTMKSILSSTA